MNPHTGSNRRRATFLSFALWLSTAGFVIGQNAEIQVAKGRVFLAAHDLASAEACFSAAVTAQPAHEAANALLAITRLLRIASLPPAQVFMDRLGLSSEGRDIYHWSAAPAKDTNGVLIAPVGVNANEFPAFYRANVIPALSASAGNLARVSNSNFLLTLARRESSLASVTIDYGDILMLRAMAHGLEYLGYTTYSWNLDAPLTALQTLAANEDRSVAELLGRFPELFTFSTTNELWLAQQAFQNAVDRYLEASAFIRSRPPNTIRLFNIDPDLVEREDLFRSTLADLRASLQGTVVLSTATNLTVHFAEHFSGRRSLRSLFPGFAGNDLLLGSWPDLSFGGVIGGLRTSTLELFLSHTVGVRSQVLRYLLVPGVFYYEFSTLPGRSYAVECSTNLTNWSEVYEFQALESSFRYFDLINNQPGQRFYRLADLSGYAKFEGRVVDACTALPLSGASVRIDSWTSITDPAGNFSIQTRTRMDDAFGLDLEISAPGYQVFTDLAYPYGFQTFALQPASMGRPMNDDFVDRIGLAGLPARGSGTVCGATTEAGVPRRSVWWSWTAPITTTATIFVDTAPVYSDLQIRVYTGGTIPTLRSLASGFYSVPLLVTNGVTYQIEIEHVSGPAGAFRLAVEAEPTLVLTSPQDGEEFRAPANISIAGIATDADGPPPRVEIRADGNTIAVLTNADFASVWSNVPPGSYFIDAEAVDASALVAYDYRYVIVHPANDDFASREPMTGRSALVFGSIRSATTEADEPAHDGFDTYHSIWWTWTAPVSGPVTLIGDGAADTVAVYTGLSLATLTFVANNWIDPVSEGRPQATFLATAGTQYQIAVDGYSGGRVALELVSASPPTVMITNPTNDAATGSSIVVSATANDIDGAILRLELFVDGRWIATTTNALGNFAVTNLLVGYHYILIRAVDSQGLSGWGTVSFRTVSPNDDFANRIALSGAHISTIGNNFGASSEAGEPDHAGLPAENSVWWEWTAPFSGAARISTSSDFDTAVAIYSGSSLPTLVEIASMDGTGGNGFNEVVFLAQAGSHYAIAVQGAFFDQGQFVLGVDLDLVPVITMQPLGQTTSAGSTVMMTVEAIGAEPLSYRWLFNGNSIPGENNAALVLANVTTAQAGRYEAVVSNAGGSVTSAPAILQVEAVVTLPEALDAPSLIWTTGGAAGWSGETVINHDGADAARSGSIRDSQESWVQTSITGPGTLTFWWKVSSESGYDLLEFYVDGVLQSGRISGEVNWLFRTISIPSGSHLIRWRYAKDGTVSAGSDRGWVDQVVLSRPSPLDTWTSQNSGTTNDLVGTAFGDGQFVAVGNSSSILLSSNVTSWTSTSSGSSDQQPYIDFVDYANSLFIAGGSGPMILTSPNGSNWTERVRGGQLWGVAYGNGRYISVGQNFNGPLPGRVFLSVNGTNWTELAGDPHTFRSVSFGAGMFMAAAFTYVNPNYYHWILSSPDGTNWTSRYSQTNGSLARIRYLNGQFIAVGDRIVRSSNGTNWTSLNLAADGPSLLQDVAYGDGAYVAVGWNYSQPAPILISGDGINWTTRAAGTNRFLEGVCYGSRRFLAVGFGGVIVTSAPFQ